MARDLFSPEHEMFRDSVRSFVETELAPYHAQWEKDQCVPRSVWKKAGDAGLLCCDMPEEYGGPGADWLYNIVVIEELARAGMTGPGFMVHSEMVAPYIRTWGSEELKQEWLPRMVTGEAIGAVAMTEPGAGSDLKEMRTRAIREGDEYVVNGQKTYISNGQNCDFILLACKTDPDAGAKGLSIILTPSSLPGFQKGRNLEKIGFKAQDTSELFFSDVHVPAGNLLGVEGGGFKMLMTKLAQERLTQAVRSMSAAEAAIQWTVDYTSERKIFGHTISHFQNTQFVLAGLAAEATALRVFTDWCIARHLKGELTPVEAAKVKLLVTDLHNKAANECLQFFGGYGYMTEYPIARAFIDARITRIAGGAAEVMKQIIARDMFSGKH
jgi:alkylation response protein AidB-like acyl-CoA dehydrogenase